MYRAASEPGTPYIGLMITPGRGVSLLWRAESGGTSFEMTDLTCQGRTYLKLVRQGDSFIGYAGNDDRAESVIGSTIVALRSHVFLGCTVSRDADLKPVRVNFEKISVT